MLEYQIFQKLDEMEKMYEEIYIKKVDKLQRKFDDFYMLVIQNIARITELERTISDLEAIIKDTPLMRKNND